MTLFDKFSDLKLLGNGLAFPLRFYWNWITASRVSTFTSEICIQTIDQLRIALIDLGTAHINILKEHF